MDFIGRRTELEILEREYAKDRSFVLVTGRRRVGKTRLIQEFVRDRKAMYFLAPLASDPSILEDFSDRLSEFSGRTYGMFRNWREALRAFVESSADKKVLILDEFQNIMFANETIQSVLQDAWDGFMSHTETMVIVCGSHISTLESLDKNHRSPLYGRLTRHIVVNPLSFEEVRDKDGDYIQEVERYSVLGGVPRYMEMFDDGNLRDNIVDNVMDPSSMMYDDPRILLRDEVDRVGGYMSIMAAVAKGNRKLSDISSAVQIQAQGISPYLSKLRQIHMLEKRAPVTEKNLENNRMGLYTISDRYTAFWFRFVYPHMGELESRNPVPAMNDFDRHFIEAHISFVFGDICRDMVRGMSDTIGFVPEKVGSYWSKNVEIDVVAVSDTVKRAFVAECKFRMNRKVDMHVLEELVAKTASAHELNGYVITYGLFSVSGFDDRLMSRGDVVLVDRGEVRTSPNLTS